MLIRYPAQTCTHLQQRPVNLDYQSAPKPRRTFWRWRIAWLLVAGVCAAMEVAILRATNWRFDGWPDKVFIWSFAAFGLLALVNAIRPPRGRRAG
jgi:hypothetical protein